MLPATGSEKRARSPGRVAQKLLELASKKSDLKESRFRRQHVPPPRRS